MRNKNLILGSVLFCCAIALGAQAPTTTIPPSPGLATFDPTQAIAAFGASSAWNKWADDSITALGKQVAAIPAGTQGIQGIQGVPGATGAVGPQGPPGAPATSLLTPGPNFTIPACSFSGISGNGPNITEPSLDSASPCDVGWEQPGERVIYTFYVPLAWNYRIITSVASPVASGTFHFEINGLKVGPTVSAPNTGGFQTNWTGSSTTSFVPLPGGIVTFTLVVDTGGFNFDQLVFIKQ